MAISIPAAVFGRSECISLDTELITVTDTPTTFTMPECSLKIFAPVTGYPKMVTVDLYVPSRENTSALDVNWLSTGILQCSIDEGDNWLDCLNFSDYQYIAYTGTSEKINLAQRYYGFKNLMEETVNFATDQNFIFRLYLAGAEQNDLILRGCQVILNIQNTQYGEVPA